MSNTVKSDWLTISLYVCKWMYYFCKSFVDSLTHQGWHVGWHTDSFKLKLESSHLTYQRNLSMLNLSSYVVEVHKTLQNMIDTAWLHFRTNKHVSESRTPLSMLVLLIFCNLQSVPRVLHKMYFSSGKAKAVSLWAIYPWKDLEYLYVYLSLWAHVISKWGRITNTACIIRTQREEQYMFDFGIRR